MPADMTTNLVMYAVVHLIEAVLAEDNRHPGCAARGVCPMGTGMS